MHLHELLNMPISDYEVERAKIEKLFFHTAVKDELYYSSLAEGIDHGFRQSKIRGTATTIFDYFDCYKKHWKHPSLDALLLYCEIVWNVILACEKEIDLLPTMRLLAVQILQNVNTILDKTGHEMRERQDDLYEIVRKDALSSAAIEDLQDRDTALAVLDYLHFGMKGDVTRKRELLRIIGHYVEPILQDAEMKASYGWLTNDLGCCLNRLHIRHNNKEGKNANGVAQAMSDAELESYYDNTYRELLLLIELQKNLPFHRKVEKLRAQLDGKKDGRKG